MPSKPYIGYIRRSRDNGSGVSEKQQRAAIELWATVNGATVLFLDPDLDESGKNLDRPSFQRALQMVRSGQAAGIVAAKLDRITRNVGDLNRLLHEANENGWNLVACDLGLDLNSRTGKLTAQILGAVAEWFLDNITEGLNTSRRDAVLKYGIHGSRYDPLGYRFTEVERKGNVRRGPLTPNEKAPRVLDAFKAVDEGNPSWLDLMRILGVRSQGNAWAILRNVVYIGTAYSGDAVRPNAHEAIVPPDIFARVQRKLDARPKLGRASGSKNDHAPLGKILRCVSCGHLMTRERTGTGNVYRCKSLLCPRPRPSVTEEIALPAIIDAVKKWHGEQYPRIAAGMAMDDALTGELERQHADAQTTVDEIETMRGKTDPAAWLAAMDDAIKRRDGFARQLQEIESSQSFHGWTPERIAAALEDRNDPEQINRILRSFVQVVVKPVGRGRHRTPVTDRLRFRYVGIDGSVSDDKTAANWAMWQREAVQAAHAMESDSAESYRVPVGRGE
jgi:DNA invertase Pin-like site-specific DNA recombinase